MPAHVTTLIYCSALPQRWCGLSQSNRLRFQHGIALCSCAFDCDTDPAYQSLKPLSAVPEAVLHCANLTGNMLTQVLHSGDLICEGVIKQQTEPAKAEELKKEEPIALEPAAPALPAAGVTASVAVVSVSHCLPQHMGRI